MTREQLEEKSAIHSELPQTGYISLNDMLPYLPIKRSTVWAWCKQNRFPLPVKIYSLTRWRCVEVQAWLDQYSDPTMEA